MASLHHSTPQMDHWYWLGEQVRCAMSPDEPRLICHYLAEGRYLGSSAHACPWHVACASLRILMDTATDILLPWHWRNQCLDHAYRPLLDLRRQAKTPAQRLQWQACAQQLANLSLLPSISPAELMQGFPDE